MTPPVIRKATRADRDGALALWRLLQQEHEAQDDRYRISEDAEARWATDFRTWTRAHTSAVWVAEADDQLAGLLTAHLAEPAPMYSGPSFVFVGDIVVAPAWRGAGLGRRLLEAAREWARQVGAGEIRAGVLATNPAGRAFWERQGATDFSVTVAIPLEGAGGPADTRR
ncbi:MAG TPA: GNAT family N-acetyltransferase [Bacteroidetes bacterium]|nr:GNAT family N-acetyltransferase [Bacteroidota bacterium]